MDVISASLSKDGFMKAPDESGINKDFTEKSTDWIATAVKRCTDEIESSLLRRRKNSTRQCA